MEERTTVESPPVEKIMSQQRPDAQIRGPGEDERATLEVASVKRAPWNKDASPRFGDGPQHASIDADEEEPTVDASRSQLGQFSTGGMGGPAMARPDDMGPGQSLGSGRLLNQQSPPAALGPAWAKLIVIAGNDNGREFPLTGKPITIGRALDNDVVLSDIAVSRKHLSLAFDGRRYLLIDHASGNGTLINDRLETGSCLLTHGDRLELGNTVFRLEHPASRGLGQPEAPADEARTVVGKSKSKRHIATLPGPGSPPPQPMAQPGQHRAPLPAPPDTLSSAPGARAPTALGPPGASAPMTLPPSVLGAPVEQSRMPTAHPEHMPASGVAFALADTQRQSDPGFGLGQGTLPAQSSPEALFATSSIGQYPPLVEPKASRRGVVIGLVLTIAVVGGAIAFVTMGGTPSKDSEQAAAADTGETKTRDRAPAAPLPRATWGTDESVMLASIGATERPAGLPDEADEGRSKNRPKDPPDRVAPVGDDQADSQITNTRPPDETEGADEPDDDQPEDDTGAENTPDIKRNVRNTKQPIKRTTAADRPSTTTAVAKPSTTAAVAKPSTAAARKRAVAQYRSKDFDEAAQTLRSAATEAGGKEAGELRALAANYEKIGAALNKANASSSRDPVDAMNAYKSALGLDSKHGEGAHASFIRSRLGAVAPKAAASYMAKEKYEAAKSAADTAVSSGAGGDPMVQRVRQGLEQEAGELYKSALRMKDEPDKANKLLERILQMVPPSSPWYSKAYKRLNTR
jgi:hypothetical protein